MNPSSRRDRDYDRDDFLFRDNIDISENVGIKEKATSIKSLVRSLELRLKGYEWDAKGDKFVYRGTALCGTPVIDKAVGLLQPFCEEANLLTIKKDLVFSRQKWEINSTFNETLLADQGCYAKNYKVIMKMFKTTLQNIGDIILGSKDIMRPVFGKDDEDEFARRDRI